MFGSFEVVILLTENMLPIPAGILIREDWGNIKLDNITGKHVLINGDKEVIMMWLKSFKDGVWINKEGCAPIMKQFILKVFE